MKKWSKPILNQFGTSNVKSGDVCASSKVEGMLYYAFTTFVNNTSTVVGGCVQINTPLGGQTTKTAQYTPVYVDTNCPLGYAYVASSFCS